MTKISIIHPSRGRTSLAFRCWDEWTSNANNKQNIEYILSCDIDDKDLVGYYGIQKRCNTKISVQSNNNVVQAMNSGAKLATGEVIVGVSDDFGCFQGWDDFILRNIDPEKEEALSINDGLQPETTLIMTLPIITKKLYDRLGYIYNPKYLGMMADNDLAERCAAMGVLKTNRSKVFMHNWRTNGNIKDETSGRHDNPLSWSTGYIVLQSERQNNYGLNKTV